MTQSRTYYNIWQKGIKSNIEARTNGIRKQTKIDGMCVWEMETRRILDGSKIIEG
jgi:hypothetical protein